MGKYDLRRMRFIAYAIVIVILAAILVMQHWPQPAARPVGETTCPPDNHDGTCVLFIGNSLTYENDLPAMFEQLARSGGHRVDTGMVAIGGATLGDHDRLTKTSRAIADPRWDTVVLQEQSQIPGIEPYRQRMMRPAARSLVGKVREAGAQPLLYLPATRRDGDPVNGLTGYTATQSAAIRGYLATGRELRVPVVPVGVAWSELLKHPPDPGLWTSDGTHPSIRGTYLAACVFYAAAFRRRPTGLPYRAGIPAALAGRIQAAAADAVLGSLARWGFARRSSPPSGG